MQRVTHSRVTAEMIVEDMVVHGATLGEIEAFLDHVPGSEERRSALWLLAWVRGTRQGPRHAAARELRAVKAASLPQ